MPTLILGLQTSRELGNSIMHAVITAYHLDTLSLPSGHNPYLPYLAIHDCFRRTL